MSHTVGLSRDSAYGSRLPVSKQRCFGLSLLSLDVAEIGDAGGNARPILRGRSAEFRLERLKLLTRGF